MSYRLPLLYKDRRMEGRTSVRRAQLVELHLLEVLKAICEAHGLRFWLTYGTLIGALRHKGFIPWDDDLDVWMLQEDYEKFVRYAREELPADVYLELPNDNPRMENGLTRLRDNYSMGLNNHSRRLLLNDHHGISIDIFTLRRAGSNNCLSNYLLHQYETTYGKWRRAKYAKVCIGSLMDKWIKFIWTWLCFGIWNVIECFYVKKPYFITRDWYLGWKFWYPVEWVIGKTGDNVRTAEFEGEQMPIPYEPELCLSKEYENFRELPPQEKRVGYYSCSFADVSCFHSNSMRYRS